jgi:hypothetical protein
LKKYPSIKQTIENKRQHRRTLAALSFEKKVEMVFKLKDRNRLIKSGKVVGGTARRK